MDTKTALCKYLKAYHVGRENAIYSRELQRIFSLDGRNIRRNVSKLRMAGWPICSDQTGYYYAGTQKEINETIGRLSSLVTMVSNARNGLLYASIPPQATDTVELTVSLQKGNEEPEELFRTTI